MSFTRFFLRPRSHAAGQSAIRSLPAWLCGLSLAGANAACLVTDKVEYGAPNVPAIVSIIKPAEPLARVPPVSDECREEGSSGTTKFMLLTADISDPNVEDELEVRVVINKEQLRIGTGAVAPTGRVDREPFRLCIDQTKLSQGCNFVEVLVSRDFQGDPPYGVKTEGDLGRDDVLVGGSSQDQPQAPMSDCYFDGGLP